MPVIDIREGYKEGQSCGECDKIQCPLSTVSCFNAVLRNLSEGDLLTIKAGCMRPNTARLFKCTSRNSGNHQEKPSEEDCSTQSMIKKD